jgi:hypothetical protein
MESTGLTVSADKKGANRTLDVGLSADPTQCERTSLELSISSPDQKRSSTSGYANLSGLGLVQEIYFNSQSPHFDWCADSPGQRYNVSPASSLPHTYIGCLHSLQHFWSGSGANAFLSVRR